jgi:hypothetical protein
MSWAAGSPDARFAHRICIPERYDRDAEITPFQLLVTGEFASPKSRPLWGLVIDFQ